MTLTRQDSVVLSRGSLWAKAIVADPANPWPDTATARCEFRNTRGSLLAEVTGDVTTTAISFKALPEVVDPVPAGAKFEVFLETADGPVKIRWGNVTRSEARFYDAPGEEVAAQARKFSDSFQRSAIGAKWEAVRGGCKIYDNSGQSLARGLGPNTGLFSNQPAALRHYRQLGGDSFEFSFSTVMPTVFGANNGKTTIVGDADLGFTTGIGVEVDSINNKLNLARITSPTSVAYLGSPINNTAVSNDLYTVRYNHLTKMLAVYKGTATSPLGTPWEDTADLIPHGNGYRYAGFLFRPTFLETGPQISGWEAKDSV